MSAIDTSDTSGSPLHDAINVNDFFKVEELLKTPEGLKHLNAQIKGDFPVHLATKSRNIKILNLLAEQGANVNQAYEQKGSMQGYTPAHFAARQGDVDIILALGKLGADLNRAATDGWTPLHAAAFSGKRQAMQTLLDQKGVNVNALNVHSQSPLVFSANRGNMGDTKVLLNKGADVSSTDAQGDTILHHATHYRMSKLFEGEYDIPEVQLDVVVVLAMYGANIDTPNTEKELATTFTDEDWPSLPNVLRVIYHNREKFRASKTEWNYLTLAAARVEIFASIGLELKHAVDLVELLKKLEAERPAAKKRREDERPAGGCPVMRGKRNKKPAGEITNGGSSTNGTNGTSSTSAPTANGGHPPIDPNLDISKIDPNGPDPSGGQCPFFKRPNKSSEASTTTNGSSSSNGHANGTSTTTAGPPVGASVMKPSTTAPPTSAPVAAAAGGEKVVYVNDDNSKEALVRTAGSWVAENQVRVLEIALAFFIGIWTEQMLHRVFGN